MKFGVGGGGLNPKIIGHSIKMGTNQIYKAWNQTN